LLYTRWQAGGSVRLDADGVFQEISRFFNESADFSEALSRMLSAGFVDKGLEVTGVDALLERIDDALRKLQSEVNFDHALDGQRELMRRVLESELSAADALNDSRDANRRQSLLGRLPAGIDGAIERLGGYGFLDADASAIFNQLTEQLDDVSRLAMFIRGRGGMFKGPDSLDYERALEFLDRIEGLLDLKNLLFDRVFDAIDRQKVENLGSPAGELASWGRWLSARSTANSSATPTAVTLRPDQGTVSPCPGSRGPGNPTKPPTSTCWPRFATR